MQLKLTTPLTADEIDFRVQQCGKSTNGIYAQFLAYKDARADMKRLDAVYGELGWQKKYEVVNNNLFCSVGIYSKELQQWIWKSDVGVPSNSEAEKGEASDAFKRACFNWGIGRELYEYPTIFLTLEQGEYQERNGKLSPTFKFLKSLKWENGFDIDGNLVLLECFDSKMKSRYKYSKK